MGGLDSAITVCIDRELLVKRLDILPSGHPMRRRYGRDLIFLDPTPLLWSLAESA